MRREGPFENRKEMKPFNSEYSLQSFFGNYFFISKIMRKNNIQFSNFSLFYKGEKDLKKDFEEKLIQGYKMSNTHEWFGTSPSKNPLRLLRIDTGRFLINLVKIMKKSDQSYDMYCHIVYHVYYKYAVFGILTIYTIPFLYLLNNKNLKTLGVIRFAPLLLLLCFTRIISENFGEIGLSRNSIKILFLSKQILSREDNSMRELIDEYMKDKKIGFKPNSSNQNQNL
jgi:hypothetical protein